MIHDTYEEQMREALERDRRDRQSLWLTGFEMGKLMTLIEREQIRLGIPVTPDEDLEKLSIFELRALFATILKKA